jgi:CheY-like chemotaxis protein
VPVRRTVVVEDDAPTRELLVELLAEEGYEVRSAADGLEGLELLTAWRPDVVLLDVLMPRADAAAFRAAQSCMPALRDVPIVLLSASRADELVELAQRLGAAAALVKPFDLYELLAVVRQVLDRAIAPSEF